MSVSLKFEENIALLTIDRPEVRNALDWDAMFTFRDLIEESHENTDIRGLIITGVGHTFIAGGDLKVLHNHSSEDDGKKLSQLMSFALQRLESLPCPTIAAINGPARGGGAEISLACDMRIMDANADLGFVQIKLGLVPGWGAGQRLLRLVGYSRALQLLTSGCVLSPEKAESIGLVNQITLPGEAVDASIKLAREFSVFPHDSVRAIKRMLRGGLYLHQEFAIALERSEFPPLWASDEHTLAVQRFLDRKS